MEMPHPTENTLLALLPSSESLAYIEMGSERPVRIHLADSPKPGWGPACSSPGHGNRVPLVAVYSPAE